MNGMNNNNNGSDGRAWPCAEYEYTCDITLHCTAAAAAVITNNNIILIVVGLIDSIYITQLTLEYKNGNNKIHERIAHGRRLAPHTWWIAHPNNVNQSS